MCQPAARTQNRERTRCRQSFKATRVPARRIGFGGEAEAIRPSVRRTSSSEVGRSVYIDWLMLHCIAPKKAFRTRGSALSSAAREGAPTQVSCTHGRCAGAESTLFGHSTHCWIHFGVLIGMPTVYSRRIGSAYKTIRWVPLAYTGAVLWWIRARTCSCGSGQGTARSRCEGSGRILGRAAASATRACIHIGHSAWSTTGSRASRGCMQTYMGYIQRQRRSCRQA